MGLHFFGGVGGGGGHCIPPSDTSISARVNRSCVK